MIVERSVMRREVEAANAHDGLPAPRPGPRGPWSTIYVRTSADRVEEVRALLAPTANPANPSQVSLSRPSDALRARVHAQSALTGLVLGLGAISMLVGGWASRTS